MRPSTLPLSERPLTLQCSAAACNAFPTHYAADTGAPYLLFDRLPIIDSDRDLITIQHVVDPAYYAARLPHRAFSKRRLFEAIAGPAHPRYRHAKFSPAVLFLACGDIAMSADMKSRLRAGAKVCSGAILILLVIAALGPAKWAPRTELGWQFDHFIGYFGITLFFCFAWPRPLVVGGVIMALAASLEGLQALTADRSANLEAAAAIRRASSLLSNLKC